MKIVVENGNARVYTPYNKEFAKAIKNIGQAKWQEGAWVVPAHMVDAVREIMLDIYGESDISTTEKVDVKVTFNESFDAYQSAVTMFGKTIARAYGRDKRVDVGEDVAFIKGAPKATGSVKNWYTEIPEKSVCIVSNVPETMLNEELPEGVTAEVLKKTVDRKALEEEKERLLARIAEIDNLLK